MFYLHSSAEHSFLLSRRSPSKVHQERYSFNGVDEGISWDSVRMVEQRVPLRSSNRKNAAVAASSNVDDGSPSCPICLCDFVCARITKCGHSFCLPCILRHVQTYTANNPYHHVKCPCCAIPVVMEDLTVIPRFSTISLAEKAIMPLLIWLAYSVFPFALMNRNRLRIVSYSNGAFMMFRRDAYRKIGGHAAIRDNVLDDMTLGRRIRQAGQRCVVVNGSAALECRMYTCMQEIYSGFAKNLFRLFSNSLPTGIAVPLSALCWLFFCLILYTARLRGRSIFHFPAAGQPHFSCCGSGCRDVHAVFSRFIYSCRCHFRYPRLMAFLYPVSIFLLFTIAMNSIIQTLTGQTEWKGRSLHAGPPDF